MGRIWITRLDDEGKPMGEPVEVTGSVEIGLTEPCRICLCDECQGGCI